ncbi:MAG: element excision factor XisH family protein [Saprospiraceae bacterium]
MAKDFFHELIRKLLVKDGWTITDDPLTIKGLTRKIYIDLAAEKIIAAERGETKIAVEVKSFLSPSRLSDFYEAIGKYSIYWDALKENEPVRLLFLALPVSAYEELLTEPFVQHTVQRLSIQMLVFNPETKKIEKWEI